MAKRFYTRLFEYEIIIMFFIVLQFFYIISPVCITYRKLIKRGVYFTSFAGVTVFCLYAKDI